MKLPNVHEPGAALCGSGLSDAASSGERVQRSQQGEKSFAARELTGAVKAEQVSDAHRSRHKDGARIVCSRDSFPLDLIDEAQGFFFT